jgi:hypothetical protein
MCLGFSWQAGEPDSKVGIDDFKLAPGQRLVAGHDRQVVRVPPLRRDDNTRLEPNQVANSEIADGDANIQFDRKPGYGAVKYLARAWSLISL